MAAPLSARTASGDPIAIKEHFMVHKTVKVKKGEHKAAGDGTLLPLIDQLRKKNIQAVDCCPNWGWGEACIEFASSADVEAFLNLVGAAAACHAQVETWDDDGKDGPTVRCRLLVCFPTANLAKMVAAAKIKNAR
jgi:hypothetical protein